MISALLLRTNIAKVQKLYFTLSPSAAYAGFINHQLSLSPLGGEVDTCSPGVDRFLQGSKVDGVYLVI